jgi:hypothetical protein
MLLAFISTGGILVVIPLEPCFAMACSLNFGTRRVDQFIGDRSGEFYNFHPSSVAQNTGGLNEGFNNEDWFSLSHI